MSVKNKVVRSTLICYLLIAVIFVAIRTLSAFGLLDFLGEWADYVFNIVVQIGLLLCLSIFLFSKLLKKKPGSVCHFFGMKKISAKERYTLLLEIDKKTIDRRQYDYTYMKKRFSEEYEKEKQVLKYLQREKNQERYDQIRHDELPAAQDNKTKINLYKELLTLVNSQDWGRTRKFNEKKTIYNHLILLYQAENMPKEAEQASYEREKFINARNISREASRIKGYSFKNNHNSGR